jgi:glycyl-tRNA synthetase beta chain
MSDKQNQTERSSPDDLLIEIGCEELPPKSLDGLREALFAAVVSGLEKEHLNFSKAESTAYSSPRRLALLIKTVAAGQPDQDLQRRGPAMAAAFDQDGKASRAAEGFARSVGMTVEQLETLENDKGSWLVAQVHVAGKTLDELIFPILQSAVRQLPVAKPMRWSDHDFSFVRPVHWLVVMHGCRVMKGELLGQAAGNQTRGHRFHSPGPHSLSSAGQYLETLRGARVLADQKERKSSIKEQLLALSPATRIDSALLTEVNNLVEWPVAIKCSFDAEFLKVPHEALVASMQDHQKFFPILSTQDSADVSNEFITVANIESSDEQQVKDGFERVIRPRLADAQFFLEQDQKHSLEQYSKGLDALLFQKKIGSIGDKSRRMSAISKNLSEYLSLSDPAFERSAQLAKCDLLTQMVGEFPELQGTMGRYYALHSGESTEVAQAIEGHYLPRFAGDNIPADVYGQVLGLSDRCDTLVAIFAAGLKPGGNKDPFALRRSALGLVRILLEAGLDVAPGVLLAMAAAELSAQGVDIESGLQGEILEFINERAKSYFREAGHGTEIVNASMASPWNTLSDLQARLQSLSSFMGNESGQSLAAANKRIGNILRKSAPVDIGSFNESRVLLEEERHLFDEVNAAEEALKPLLKEGHYADALEALSLLRPSVDRFFDAVMVMDEDVELRNNRLVLLSRLKGLFDQVADLSVLA